MTCKDIPLIIFAGGESKRMGQNKALLPFSSASTLTEYQYQRLKPYFSNIYISCKNKNIFNFNADFIEDIYHKESSPLVGLYSIFEKIDSDLVAILSVDTPFVSVNNYEKLLNSLNHEDAVLPYYHPLCGVYRKDTKSIIKELLEQKKYSFKHFFEKIKVKYIEVENKNEFLNLNFYEDYKKALKRIENEKYFD